MDEEKNIIEEETEAFTDLMTRSERKEWERTKQLEIDEQMKQELEEKIEITSDNKPESNRAKRKKLREERIRKNKELRNKEALTNNNEVEEIINDTKPLISIEEVTVAEETEEKQEDLVVGDVTKSQIFTEETLLNIEEEKDLVNDEPNKFNPIFPLGISTILLFLYLAYIIFNSNYTENLFLIINGISLFLILFIFGITVLCNRKLMKVFAIINTIFIISFIIFNVVSINNWNWYDKKEKKTFEDVIEKQPEKEVVIKKEYSCSTTDNTIEVTINIKNDIISELRRIEVFENESIAEEMKSYFEDTNGFKATLSEKTLMTEYDFSILDINQYKLMIKEYNDAFREPTDFSYIEKNQINYEKYIEIELNGFVCMKKEG